MKTIIYSFIFIFLFVDGYSQVYRIKHKTQTTSTISINNYIKNSINGLELSGTVELFNNKGFVEIYLIDSKKNRYLVQEYFVPLNNPGTLYVIDCEDLDLINNIRIDSIGIICSNAEVSINSIEAFKQKPKNRKSREEIISDKIYNLNHNLKSDGFLWRASLTQALKSYNSRYRKKEKSTFGFEYYDYGIFTAVSPSDIQKSSIKQSSSYIDHFDWRYQHGAMQPNSPYYDNSNMDYANGQSIPNGWMTPIHCQDNFDSTKCKRGCIAFAAINALEARLNLFYNNHLDYDLSEQDAIDCNSYNTHNYNCYTGGHCGFILRKAKYNYIVNENCFPFVFDTTNCIGKCSDPTNKITIEHFYTYYNPSTNFLKGKLICNGPIPAEIYTHAMCLVGYGIVYEGMILDNRDGFDKITVSSNSNYIGMTYYIWKNSRTAVDSHNGYVYTLNYDSGDFFRAIDIAYVLYDSIEDLNNPNLTVSCRDEDNDGYYNWGIGPKPSHCPPCPDEPDGDDSNPCLGPMDAYGNCQDISGTKEITSSETWTNDRTICGGLKVKNGGNLTVNGSNVKITNNNNFEVEIGGTFLMTEGEISFE